MLVDRDNATARTYNFNCTTRRWQPRQQRQQQLQQQLTLRIPVRSRGPKADKVKDGTCRCRRCWSWSCLLLLLKPRPSVAVLLLAVVGWQQRHCGQLGRNGRRLAAVAASDKVYTVGGVTQLFFTKRFEAIARVTPYFTNEQSLRDMLGAACLVVLRCGFMSRNSYKSTQSLRRQGNRGHSRE